MPKGKMWTTDEDFNEGCEFQKVGSDGYPFCASSTEIMRLRDDLQRANAENAKLRELVRVFYHCTTSGVCDECPVNGGGAVHLMPDTICDVLHDRMRELGVDA